MVVMIWLAGFIANHATDGLRHAYYLVPACYLVLLFLLVLDRGERGRETLSEREEK
ncbi:MAG: hypothetical protein ACNA71_01785 [Kiritimatiellia bacterium]